MLLFRVTANSQHVQCWTARGHEKSRHHGALLPATYAHVYFILWSLPIEVGSALPPVIDIDCRQTIKIPASFVFSVTFLLSTINNKRGLI